MLPRPLGAATTWEMGFGICSNKRMDLPHLPALRLGRAYESLEKIEVRDHRNGEPVAAVSQVNAGIIRRDLAQSEPSRAALKKFTCAELIEMCKQAAEVFMKSTLPLGDKGHTQSSQQYVETLSRTSGLAYTLVRRNMDRISTVLLEMGTVLRGLTRGLDLSILDNGFGEQDGIAVGYFATTNSLGVIMPSNSPAVNALWLPAIALKIPVVLKPGREEPFTPWRLIQSFLAAGVPTEAFGFYPSDHEGAGEILRLCGRAQLFGDKTTTDRYAADPRIEIHGPGYSKILVGPDEIERWPRYVDLMVESIAQNGGRSCLNASTVIVPAHADKIADGLAQRLGPVEPRPIDDENAMLAGFPNPKIAESINAAIDEGLQTSGAEEVTARYRIGPRLVTLDGAVYLRPTVVRCDSFAHPLAIREFLFPYASVLEVPSAEMVESIGPSLVITAITRDEHLIERLTDSPHVARLHIGPLSTMQVSWDQPHEGNLFELLYKRRAIQRV
jgi:acyl-CoA reductase-like NAD-dependent aldehyde dehydrogenase